MPREWSFEVRGEHAVGRAFSFLVIAIIAAMALLGAAAVLALLLLGWVRKFGWFGRIRLRGDPLRRRGGFVPEARTNLSISDAEPSTQPHLEERDQQASTARAWH